MNFRSCRASDLCHHIMDRLGVQNHLTEYIVGFHKPTGSVQGSYMYRTGVQHRWAGPRGTCTLALYTHHSTQHNTTTSTVGE